MEKVNGAEQHVEVMANTGSKWRVMIAIAIINLANSIISTHIIMESGQ